MLEGLKPGFNNFLRPVTRVMAWMHIRPNHLTIAGTLFFIVAGWLSAIERWYLGFVAVGIGSLMDAMDGLLARDTNQKTIFGAILDSSCDRITEIALLMGLLVFYVRNPVASYWAVYLCFSAITSSIMVSYIKARCEGAGVSCSRGLLQRPERIILLLSGLLAGPIFMAWILLIITILATITVIQRLAEASVQSKRVEER